MAEKEWTLEEAPLLPLRNVVVFPYMVLPLFVGRPKSIKSIEESLEKDRLIVLATQKDELKEDPSFDDVFHVGVGAEILQLLKLPDGTNRVLIEGLKRVVIKEFKDTGDHLKVKVEIVEEDKTLTSKQEALMKIIIDQFTKYVDLSKKIPTDIVINLLNVNEPGRFADIAAANILLGVPEKQDILSLIDTEKRLEKISTILTKEIMVLELARKLEMDVKEKIDKTQKEFYLREQLKAIEKELGEEGEGAGEVGEYRAKMKKTKLSPHVEEKINEELKRLSKTPSMSPESSVIRTYLDWLLDLPWEKRTKDNLNLIRARKFLEEDHYGLEDVKERIVEYLAVRQLAKKTRGPIICFVGPPGVGKTSVGKSIARTLGRKFVRVSLGGIRDEAEIRGHRRTYVGALPGRIIQGIKQAGNKNPVFLLDEIDKVGLDFRGDPTAALLEALDPEQNTQFSDHYIEIPFDLSEVLFITTANVSDTIPPALLDRMEVIPLPGYTDEEKYMIAKNFLMPKSLKFHGLKKEDFSIFDSAIYRIIREYTREAGVRNLERQITKICRKIATEKVTLKSRFSGVKIDEKNLETYLDMPLFKYGVVDKKERVGVACGLVVTQFGGDTVYVEATKMPGKGILQLTGQLGEVMKESAQAAFSFLRSHSTDLNIEENFYEKYDIHVHVPEGAVPKEGPSAGVTIAIALASVLTGRYVRSDTAMTGEITLRGQILPVGGIKEKVLGAYRSGIKKVILPDENEKNLQKISKEIKDKMEFYLVKDIKEALDKALI